MVKVKNIVGTSDKKCKCGDWLKHWENKSSKPLPPSCREITCSEKELVGAHVKKVNSTDNNHYIVPLCQSHNKSDKEFDIMDDYLVSATCD